MTTTKLPQMLTFVVGSGVLLASCASQPLKPAANAPNRPVPPASSDDREFNMNAGGWETPPPYAQRRN